MLKVSTSLPKIKKIKKSLVIITALFLFILLVFSMGILKGAAKTNTKDEQEKPIPTDNRLNLVSFNELPENYSKIEEDPPPISLPQKNLAPDLSPNRPENIKADPEQGKLKEKALNSNIFFNTENKTTALYNEAQRHQPYTHADDRTFEMMGKALECAQPGNRSETRINQQNKQQYLDKKMNDASPVYLNHRIQEPLSPYQIMAGTVLPAVLITGINSDLPGNIIGQIRENIYDTVTGNYLLVPQGSRIIGVYDNMITWGQNKVSIVWSRLMMPDGSSIIIDNMPGSDLSGYSGLHDRVNNHYMKLSSAILLSTILSVGAVESQGDTENYRPSIRQQLAANIGANINKAGQKILDRQLDVPPTIEIKPGHSFNIMVNKDVILREYTGG